MNQQNWVFDHWCQPDIIRSSRSLILILWVPYPSPVKLARNDIISIFSRPHSCSVDVSSANPLMDGCYCWPLSVGFVNEGFWSGGAAKSQTGKAARWREARWCWWDHWRGMIHSLTLGMLTPQREGREWGASRSRRAAAALSVEESAFAAALGGGGEITGEARAESPTKSGIRGELQRQKKFRWREKKISVGSKFSLY